MPQGSFASRKFFSLLPAAVLALAVEYAVQLSNGVLAGNMLGEQALAAVTLVQPFFAVTSFAAYLVCMGTVLLATYEAGRRDRLGANRYFSQGLILSVAAGCLLSTFFWLFKDRFFAGLGLSPGLTLLAGDYFSFLLWLPAVQITAILLYSAVINEGGAKLCVASSLVQLAGTVGTSFVLCKAMGIAGIGAGVAVGNVLIIAVLGLHFFTKGNMLRFVPYITLSSSLRALKYGLSESLPFLYLAVTAYFLNGFLLRRFGEDAVVVFSAVMNAQVLLMSCTDGVAQAMQPLISVYRGENNLHGIRKTMRPAFGFMLLESAAIGAALWIFAPSIPGLLGIRQPELALRAAEALRTYAPASVCFCAALLLSIYFIYMGGLWTANCISAMLLLVLPPLCVVRAAEGVGGVWLGLALAAVLGLVFALALVRVSGWGKTFPLRLDATEMTKQSSRDVPATAAGVADLSAFVESALAREGISAERVEEARRRVEEVCSDALKRREGAPRRIECTVFAHSDVTVVLRDDGAYGAEFASHNAGFHEGGLSPVLVNNRTVLHI